MPSRQAKLGISRQYTPHARARDNGFWSITRKIRADLARWEKVVKQANVRQE
jgi:hypothetical protein